MPHERGRVEPGVYVTGWIKRGPTGFIGTNKSCAQETVTALLDDLETGRLTAPAGPPVTTARPDAVDLDGWRAIDAAERAEGRAQGRPRVSSWTARTCSPPPAAPPPSDPRTGAIGSPRQGYPPKASERRTTEDEPRRRQHDGR